MKRPAPLEATANGTLVEVSVSAFSAGGRLRPESADIGMVANTRQVKQKIEASLIQRSPSFILQCYFVPSIRISGGGWFVLAAFSA